MNSNKGMTEDANRPRANASLHGARLRTLDAIFRHPTAHNLEWMDVVALMEKLGTVSRDSHDKFAFTIGAQHFQMHKPHTKDLTSSEIADLR